MTVWSCWGAVRRRRIANMKSTTVLLVAALLLWSCTTATSPALTASPLSEPLVTATASSSAAVVPVTGHPVGYELEPECTYTGSAEVRRGMTWWPISCPTGLPFALIPSLAAQGWEYCGCGATCTYRTNEWFLFLQIDNRQQNGALAQRPRAERPGITPADCVFPTP